MKAGIMIDSYKLGIYERRLKEAGYTYVRSRGISPDTLLLTVTTDNKEALEVVVRAANAEATGIGKLM